MMVMDEFLQFLKNNGTSSIAIIGLAYICIRLFGKEHGILTKVSENHIEFVNELKSTQEKHLGHQEDTNDMLLSVNTEMVELKKEMKSLMQEHFNPDSHFATVRLHKYGLHACDVLEMICKQMGIEDTTTTLLIKMRECLNKKS